MRIGQIFVLEHVYGLTPIHLIRIRGIAAAVDEQRIDAILDLIAGWPRWILPLHLLREEGRIGLDFKRIDPLLIVVKVYLTLRDAVRGGVDPRRNDKTEERRIGSCVVIAYAAPVCVEAYFEAGPVNAVLGS